MFEFKNIWQKLFSQQKKPDGGFTPALLRAIWDEVEADPYIGLGNISRKDYLLDRYLCAWNLHTCIIKGVPVTAPRALLQEQPLEPVPLPSNFKVTRPTEVKKPATATPANAAAQAAL